VNVVKKLYYHYKEVEIMSKTITIPISERDIDLFEQQLRAGHRMTWFSDDVEVILVMQEGEEE
jgi:hypothetical protein|tara:strand:- start:103 stop:291 length:189 start_codon:yes stop_codon:yes gene_type:complete